MIFQPSRWRLLAAVPFFFFSSIVKVSAEESDGMPVYELEPLIRVAPNVMSGKRISGKSIRTAKPIDLAEILSSEMPSIAPARKSPTAGDIVLRGLSRDNVLITVDETKTFCACPNRMDPPAFHVSSQQIDSIQVRPGPFSVDQGGTIGGTVFVRTNESFDHPFLRAYGYAGSYDYVAGGITGGGPLSKNFSALGGIYDQQGGVYEDGAGIPFTKLSGTNYRPDYFDATAFKVFNGEAKAAYTLSGGGSITGNYAYQDATDVLYPGLQMDARSDTMNRGAIAIRLPSSSALASTVEVSAAYSHVDHDMSDAFRTSVNNMAGAFAGRGYFMRTQAETSYTGARLKATKSFDKGQARYGVDAQRRLWDADNVVGSNLNNMLPDTVTDRAGAWAVVETRRDQSAFESGARLDLSRSEARDNIDFVQSLRGTKTNERRDVLPSIYGLVSHDFSDRWNGYTGIGFATREPDAQERYISLNRPMTNPDWVGNPDINPVKSLEIQPGARWSNKVADAKLSLFHSWLFDYIYLESLPLTSPARATSYTNIDARLYGGSADVGYSPFSFLRLEGNLAWQEGVKETKPAQATNRVLAEVPPLRGRLSASGLFDRWSIRTDLLMQARLHRIDTDLNEKPIAGWGVLNIAASVRLMKSLTLGLGVDNAFNKTYAVANSFVRDPFSNNTIVNEPGRFYYARLGAEF
ncbi:MAG: hypothetical protein KCHDKBKB_02559 [Elusimicrobia bacterium]|nr:hypothetical protein [Elusimicrobiota bacterium]